MEQCNANSKPSQRWRICVAPVVLDFITQKGKLLAAASLSLVQLGPIFTRSTSSQDQYTPTTRDLLWAYYSQDRLVNPLTKPGKLKRRPRVDLADPMYSKLSVATWPTEIAGGDSPCLVRLSRRDNLNRTSRGLIRGQTRDPLRSCPAAKGLLASIGTACSSIVEEFMRRRCGGPFDGILIRFLVGTCRR
ncbi:hypothetical protein ABW19_dt0210171 [Dactylella cylindrospora]|nr:hypothetical protein ABW19_dt0210171 [Dactylella cylindrospora]